MVKAIFCVNPGRSGSHYLAKLFSCTDNCESHHEATPNGFGLPLQKCNLGDCDEMRDIAKVKISEIAKSNRKGLIYCETSHGFIKGFGWPIMDLINQTDVGVVILKRDKKSFIDSTIRVHSGPLNDFGRKYILTPDRSNPKVKPPAFFCLPGRIGYRVALNIFRIIRKVLYRCTSPRIFKSSLNYFMRYQRKCVSWYWDETYALADNFKTDYPKCKYYETNTKELNDIDKVLEMMKFFDIVPNKDLEGVVGKPSNLKKSP